MADLTGTNPTATIDDDRILGTTGTDTLVADDGNDILTGDAGNDTIDGGLGEDTVNYGSTTVNGTTYAGATEGIDVSLADGTSYNDGHGDTDTLTNIENVTGSEHDDLIEGSDVNNTIEGGDGTDDLSGLAGDDTFIQTGTDGDIIDGGSHTTGTGDTVDYSRTVNSTNLNINLQTGIVSDGTGANNDLITDIENIVTGKGNDTVTLVDGIRNTVTHTTNVDENNQATTTAGNGGNDTVNNFQVGNNISADGTTNPQATFDVLDLSQVIVPISGNRADYITVIEVSDNLVVSISASADVNTGTDITTVTFTGLSYSDLETAYGLTAGDINSSTTAVTALLDNGNLLLGSDTGIPSIDLPQEHNTVESDTITFDGVNQIIVTDLLPDNTANANELVTVKVEVRDASDPDNAGGDGILVLGSNVPTAFTDGDPATGTVSGDGTVRITLTGTTAQINQALTDLRFEAADNNNAEDQLLRVTIEDNDGNNVHKDVELIVKANVEQAASLVLANTEVFLDDGVTSTALNITLTLPSDDATTATINEATDADGSENTLVDIAGVPTGASLSSASTAAAVSSYTNSDNVIIWRISGSAANVQSALADLTVSGLQPSDYPLSFVVTPITTDVDAEGINHEVSGSAVTLTIDGYATDVNTTPGDKTIGTAAHEKIYGADASADQLVGGVGSDVLNGATGDSTTDQSNRDIAYYAQTDSDNSDITEGVDVNLTTGEGRGGHAQGDSYTNIEGAVGTELNDRFTGVAAERNYFWGGEGSDTFVADLAIARRQDDVFSGGSGKDVISLENVVGNTTLNLTQSSQDLNNDGIRDVRISSIEEVISGAGNDAITFKYSTQTTIGGAVSGALNENTLHVNRVDSGSDTLIDFDINNDKLDLSGVLKTGNAADLNTYVTVTDNGTDTVISIDKDKDGTADSTVTLQGVTGHGYTDAAALSAAGVLTHTLPTTLASINGVEDTNNQVGGRDTFNLVYSSEAAPIVGAEYVISIGNTQVTYTAVAGDSLVDAINGLVLAVNSQGLDVTATTMPGNIIHLEADVGVNIIAGDLSHPINVIIPPFGSTLTLNVVEGTNDNNINQTGTIAKIVVGGTEYYGASYDLAGSTNVVDAISDLVTVLNAAGITSSYNGSTTLAVEAFGVTDLETGILWGTSSSPKIFSNDGYIWDSADLPFIEARVAALGHTISIETTIGFNFDSGITSITTTSTTESNVTPPPTPTSTSTSTSTSATAEEHTITLAGDIVTDSEYSVTVNGQVFTVKAIDGDTNVTLRDRLITEINGDTRVVNEIQHVTLNPAVNWKSGDVYTVTVNGTEYNYTLKVGDTIEEARDGILNAINGIDSKQTYTVDITTAGNTTDVVTITIAGTAYSYTVQVGDDSAAVIAGLRDVINTNAPVHNITTALNATGQLVITNNSPADLVITTTNTGTAVSTGTNVVGNYTTAPQAGVLAAIGGSHEVLTITSTDTAITVTSAYTDSSIDATAQITTLDVIGTLENTDIYSVTLDGTAYSVTVGTDVTLTADDTADRVAIATALKTAIDGSVTGGVITTVDAAGQLTITTDSALSIADTSNDVGTAGGTAASLTVNETQSYVPTPSVDSSATDVAQVQGYSDNTTPIANAVASGTDAITLTSSAAGNDLTISSNVKNGIVDVLEGEQYYYANNGIVDTFTWRDDAIAGNDTVEGFIASEDVIDLSDVLDGVSTTLSDYLTVTDAGNGADVTITVDADGDGSTTDDQFSITLLAAGTGALNVSTLIDDGTVIKPDVIA